MIHTSEQLKDKVRNLSRGDNQTAQMLIRNFIMERFLERVSLSDLQTMRSRLQQSVTAIA